LDLSVGLKSDGTTGRRDTWRSICHGSLSRRCLRATDARRDTGPWRCSSDGTDDETRFIGLVLFSVKGSLKLWALVSIFSEWFTEM